MTPAPVPSLVDTHAHLQDAQFGADLGQVLSRAREAGVRAMVCVGYDVDSSRKAVELANRHDVIFAAVGVHPNYAGQAAAADWAEISRLARLPRVVGVGETGLDNYRDFTPPDV